MSKIEPKFSKNDRVEFMLRDDSAKSGYSHHVGYVKRSLIKKRLFRKDIVLYCICESKKEERYLWCDVPENDILGIVDFNKESKNKPIEIKEHKTFKDFKDLEELKK